MEPALKESRGGRGPLMLRRTAGLQPAARHPLQEKENKEGGEVPPRRSPRVLRFADTVNRPEKASVPAGGGMKGLATQEHNCRFEGLGKTVQGVGDGAGGILAAAPRSVPDGLRTKQIEDKELLPIINLSKRRGRDGSSLSHAEFASVTSFVVNVGISY